MPSEQFMRAREAHLRAIGRPDLIVLNPPRDELTDEEYERYLEEAEAGMSYLDWLATQEDES